MWPWSRKRLCDDGKDDLPVSAPPALFPLPSAQPANFVNFDVGDCHAGPTATATATSAAVPLPLQPAQHQRPHQHHHHQQQPDRGVCPLTVFNLLLLEIQMARNHNTGLSNERIAQWVCATPDPVPVSDAFGPVHQQVGKDLARLRRENAHGIAIQAFLEIVTAQCPFHSDRTTIDPMYQGRQLFEIDYPGSALDDVLRRLETRIDKVLAGVGGTNQTEDVNRYGPRRLHRVGSFMLPCGNGGPGSSPLAPTSAAAVSTSMAILDDLAAAGHINRPGPTSTPRPFGNPFQQHQAHPHRGQLPREVHHQFIPAFPPNPAFPPYSGN